MDNRNSVNNERSLTEFITRLGEHTAHIASHSFSVMKNKAGDALAPATLNLSEKKLRRRVRAAEIKEMRALYRERFRNRREGLGTAAAVRLMLKDLSGDIKRNTPVPAAVFNAAFPVVCIGVLGFAVQGRLAREYAVEVELDGDTIGIVTDENIYGQAKQAVTEKLPSSPSIPKHRRNRIR